MLAVEAASVAVAEEVEQVFLVRLLAQLRGQTTEQRGDPVREMELTAHLFKVVEQGVVLA
jgi:hypothetical protein